MQRNVSFCVDRHTQHAIHAQINTLFNSSMIFLSIITDDYNLQLSFNCHLCNAKTKIMVEYLIVLVNMLIFSHGDRQDQRNYTVRSQ